MVRPGVLVCGRVCSCTVRPWDVWVSLGVSSPVCLSPGQLALVLWRTVRTYMYMYMYMDTGIRRIQ